MVKATKSKLEYSDEPDVKEDESKPEQTTTSEASVIHPMSDKVEEPPPPTSIKKARSDAQKATTARMRVKLEERRRDLVVIKQEAKATALLQQMELKAHIKENLKAKQLKSKADEKMRQMLLLSESEEDEEDEEEEEEEPEIVYKKQPMRRATPTPQRTNMKQLPSGQKQIYLSQQFPSVRFV